MEKKEEKVSGCLLYTSDAADDMWWVGAAAEMNSWAENVGLYTLPLLWATRGLKTFLFSSPNISLKQHCPAPLSTPACVCVCVWCTSCS